MYPKPLIAILLALAAGPATATTFTWTNTAGGSWATAANWSSAPTFAADDVLDFSTLNITADRTATLDADRIAGALKFGDATTASNNWIVSAGTPSTSKLTLSTTSGTPTIEVVNQTATISAQVVGTQGFQKIGVGTLSINNGSNNGTLSGLITVSAGVLSAAAGSVTTNQLGTATVTVSDGATLNLNSSRGTYSAITLNGAGASGLSGALLLGGSSSFSSITVTNLTLGSNATIGTANSQGNGNGIAGAISLGANTLTCNPLTPAGAETSEALTLSAAITGTGGIVQNGPGQTTLSGTNGYTGTATALAGALIASKSAALPGYDAAGKVVFLGGTVGAQIGGAGWTTAQVDTLLTNATKTSGALGIDTNNANLTQWTAFTTSNLGPLGLNKLGSNTLTLNQANTYTGNTIVTAGTLLPTTAAALPGYDAAGKVVFLGGTLDLQVGGAGWTTAQVDTLLANATKTRGTLGLDTTNGNVTQWAAFTNTNLSSTLGLIKLGNNTLTLVQTNTYTGVTTVSAGTLQFAKKASLYNGTTASWTATNVNVKSAATLALNVGGTNEFASGDVDTLLTNISVAGNANAGLQSGAILAFDTTNATGATFTQGNLIANSTGTSGGAIGLTKLGTGTLVLDKTNTYTGVTKVGRDGGTSGGTLTVSGDPSAANGGWDIQNGTVNFQSGTTINVASGKSINTGGGTNNNLRNLNVAGTVVNAGSLGLNGGAVFTLNSGAGWTQSGTVNIKPNTTFTSNVLTVNTGAIFKYTNISTAFGLSASAGSNGGSSTLSIAGGSFETGMGFVNSGGTNGSANLQISAGGTLKLTANVPDLASNSGTTTPFNVQVGTGGGIVDTNGFNTTLNLAITGTGGLTKAGAGTLTTAVANTYTGNTTVTGGTLSLAAANLDDASSVTIATGATLTLNFAGTDTVAALSINGSALPAGTYNSTTHPGSISGTGQITVTGGANFASWASGLGLSGNPNADYDHDGISDAAEYVLGTDPKVANTGGSGIQIQKSGNNLVVTFNRTDASETSDITLTVEAGNNLQTWTQVFQIGDTTAHSTSGVVVTENGASPDTVVVTIPTAGSPKLFARLRVAVSGS
ncbi:autotransporter-associated beta strand repeat-containing protein [Luteolibacter sp. LG18]|uniref:beta strand repeat-containing protein n=1 Tax=Luteolibacter sp. LG18 TaxID=2819286 RepID=UPI0030C6E276